MTSPSVGVGGAMSPDEEADHRQRLAAIYADDAEKAVETIEAKIFGMQDSLKAAKAEAKRLRAEAKKGGAE